MIIFLILILINNGIIHLNIPSFEKYPVRGIDISWRQGQIDWQAMRRQSISFVFIKATEGGDHKDRLFEKNWNDARAAEMHVGAYHFFRAETDGAAQAINFMVNVPRIEGVLPPVVDFECSPKKHGANAEKVLSQLNVMLLLLESYYGKRPILYATKESYDFFLKGRYDHPFWSRDIFFEPDFPQKEGWLFWQYSSRGRLEGVNGTERFVDLNVFNGSIEDFQQLTK